MVPSYVKWGSEKGIKDIRKIEQSDKTTFQVSHNLLIDWNTMFEITKQIPIQGQIMLLAQLILPSVGLLFFSLIDNQNI